ncbi:MAG: hypothetical protein ABIT01_02070 [Thermoanaerobaculia bacterium]
MEFHKYLVKYRLNKTGLNRMHLTAKGRDAVVAAGVATARELFVPRVAVALKDLAHTCWINDVSIVLRSGTPRAFDTVQPAWALQRLLVPAPVAIPDILAIRKPRPGDAGRLLCLEIDLGGERLKATFIPKLGAMAGLLLSWAQGTPVGIVVLTKGTGRAASLKAQLAEVGLPVPIAIEMLPREVARPGLVALRVLLAMAM